MRKHLLPYIVFGALASSVAAASSPGDRGPDISYICLEAESGLVLAEHRAGAVRPPASMLKLLLLLLIDEGVEQGAWRLDTPVTATAKAAGMGGTQVYLKAGETFPLEALAEAIAVASANDASMAAAESLFGSEAACLDAMNRRAKVLGMKDTHFYSVNGLPPDKGESFDETTARDMALLARACLERPRIRAWTGQRELSFRDGKLKKSNTNKLLWRMPGCDGLKTGYIRAAGFCITATAERNGVRLIAVVMGHPSKYGRFNLAEELMDEGFGELSRYRLFARGQAVGQPVRVRNARVDHVRLVVADDVWLTMRDADKSRIEIVAHRPQTLEAPVPAGQEVGKAEVQLNGQTLAEVRLLVAQQIDEPSPRNKLLYALEPIF